MLSLPDAVKSTKDPAERDPDEGGILLANCSLSCHANPFIQSFEGILYSLGYLQQYISTIRVYSYGWGLFLHSSLNSCLPCLSVGLRLGMPQFFFCGTATIAILYIIQVIFSNKQN